MLRHPPEHVLNVGPIDPKFNRIYKAHSRSDPNKSYEVNVAQLTCTCLNFQSSRAEHVPGDVRRVCAHLYDKLYQTKAEKSFEPVIQLIIRYGRKEHHFHRVQSAGSDIVFGFSSLVPWVRMLAIFGNDSVLGSYSLAENRWVGDDEWREEIRQRHDNHLLSELKQLFSWHP